MKEKNIHFIFEVSVILKGLNAIGEMVGGAVALIISQRFIIRLTLFLTQNELSEDPNDKIANYLLHSAQQLSISAKYFIAFYLLSHGIIKLVAGSGFVKK